MKLYCSLAVTALVAGIKITGVASQGIASKVRYVFIANQSAVVAETLSVDWTPSQSPSPSPASSTSVTIETQPPASTAPASTPSETPASTPSQTPVKAVEVAPIVFEPRPGQISKTDSEGFGQVQLLNIAGVEFGLDSEATAGITSLLERVTNNPLSVESDGALALLSANPANPAGDVDGALALLSANPADPTAEADGALALLGAGPADPTAEADGALALLGAGNNVLETSLNFDLNPLQLGLRGGARN
jgi:hypothetical protein